MRTKPLNRQAPFRFDLSVCVQRAALRTPTPFGRTLSFQDSATRLFEVRTPVPIASLGPLPQNLSRTERRSQNRSEQQRVCHPQHRNPGKLEERQGRLRDPHRMASYLLPGAISRSSPERFKRGNSSPSKASSSIARSRKTSRGSRSSTGLPRSIPSA
jgi:hypothetical protein